MVVYNQSEHIRDVIFIAFYPPPTSNRRQLFGSLKWKILQVDLIEQAIPQSMTDTAATVVFISI